MGFTMISDDERREVARMLREVDMDDFGSYSEEHEVIETILGCWLGCEHENEPLNDRLADLIEPEPERTCNVVCYPDDQPLHYETCSNCGTILAKEKPEERHSQTANYCPNCGAKVMDE